MPFQCKSAISMLWEAEHFFQEQVGKARWWNKKVYKIQRWTTCNACTAGKWILLSVKWYVVKFGNISSLAICYIAMRQDNATGVKDD